MTITLKSPREVEIMRDAGRIVANTLQELREAVAPGVTTKQIDVLTEESLRRQGAIPAFPYINNFPGSVCISVNQEVVHGIPGPRRLREGDLVKLDVGAIYQDYHGDAAITVGVGEVAAQARRLMDVTEECLARAIAVVGPDAHLFDIGEAIQDYVQPQGFSVVRQYVGHGIGRQLHEEPNVPHFKQASRGLRLRPGMTFTIEPMINAGTHETVLMADEWTVVTKDKKLSAQFEHTVAVTDRGVDVLTSPEHGKPWSIPFQVAERVQ